MIPVNDFAFYWSSAHQFATGQNPYVPGIPGQRLVMFGPPWTLAVTGWMGLFSLQNAGFLWMVAAVLLVWVSAFWLWELYGEGHDGLWAVVLTFATTGVATALIMCQITPLILFALAGFLRYEEKRPWLAGSLLFLATLKPHTVFLVWPALVLCALFQKRWKPLAGFALTFAAANLFVWAVRPNIFREWLAMGQGHQLAFFQTDTLSAVLWRAMRYRGMQYFPAVVALIWFLWRWFTTKHWRWKEQMPALILASLLATPYSWFADHAIMLPAVFYAAARVWETKRKGPLAAAYFAISFPILILGFGFHQEFWFAWYALIWVVLYAIAFWPEKVRRISGSRIEAGPPVDSLQQH